MVYGVAVQGDFIWTATAAGASRLNTRTGQWACSTSATRRCTRSGPTPSSVGPTRCTTRSGAVAFSSTTIKTERWKDYNDPDGETEIVLFKDQGLIHEITTSVSYVDKVLWVATYFGDSRYDGRNWHNFMAKDSGLPSNFTNQVKALDANRAWFSPTKVSPITTARIGRSIVPRSIPASRRCTCAMPSGKITNLAVDSAPAHNYVLGVDFQGNDIWVATAKGLSHGIRSK